MFKKQLRMHLHGTRYDHVEVDFIESKIFIEQIVSRIE